MVFARKFTNQMIIQPIKIEGHSIQPTNTAKYLGITLDTRLPYNEHFKKTIQKVYSVTNAVLPLLAPSGQLNTSNKKLIYRTIIRPILTYAAPVWQSAFKTVKSKLQQYQNKCLRLVKSKDRYTKITDLHRLTRLPTLDEYIYNISEKFYTHKLNANRQTEHIRDIRRHNAPFGIKHKLPYQNLPIFNQT